MSCRVNVDDTLEQSKTNTRRVNRGINYHACMFNICLIFFVQMFNGPFSSIFHVNFNVSAAPSVLADAKNADVEIC